MSRRRLAWILLSTGVLAGGVAFAESPPDDVYVYTNADLEQLEPIPEATACCREDYGGWEFVQAFIDRQHRRLDADREFDLRQRMNLVVSGDIAERGLPRPVASPYWGFNRFGFGYRYAVPFAPRAAAAPGKRGLDTGRPFVPFHATRSGGAVTLTPRSGRAGGRLTASPRLAHTSVAR